MTLDKIIFLCCLPALYIADVGAEDPLIVGPGETLNLQAPEAGAGLEAALDGGPLRPIGDCSPAGECRATLTAPTTGDHWLALASRDRAGNLSPIRWIRLRVDGEPPRVELGLEPMPVERDRRWLPPRAAVTASVVDDLAGVDQLFLAVGDEVRKVSGRRASTELPAAGEVDVRAWAVDRAGNRSTETKLALAIDSTPPSGDIRVACTPAAGDDEVVVAPNCRITVEVIDGESGIAGWAPRIDGEDAAAESLDGPWSAGPHAIEVTALDAVGNEAVIGPFAFTADGAGPEISWRVSSTGVSRASGETFYLPPVEVTVDAVDSPAGLARLSASADGESYLPIDGPLEVDGDQLMLRAVDGVGNASEAEASWRLDLTPPEIRLETSDGRTILPETTLELIRGDAIRVQATDRGAGVEAATYSISVESADILRRWWWSPPQNEPLPDELIFPWPGKIDLEVEAIDRLGNRQTARWHVVVRPDRPVKGDPASEGGP